MTEPVILDGETLRPSDLRQVARDSRPCRLSDVATKRMERSRGVIEQVLKEGKTVYGVNTGFGKLSSVAVPMEQLESLQLNLVRSHAAGTGSPLPEEAARAAMTLRANVLARGHSGIRPETVELLVSMLNRGVVPQIPSKGSVGASGDLAPLAHLALVLIGEGQAQFGGRLLSGSEALEEAGLDPIRLLAKEGLALINGTQVSTAIGTLAVLDALSLIDQSDIIGALSIEALRGSAKAFDARIIAARPHQGALQSAERLTTLLASSPIGKSHMDCGKVQDAYSLRCMPQVHGAARDACSHALAVLEVEMNASTDNPMVFSGEGEVISGGNFHGSPVGLVLDYAAIACTQAASISERRLAILTNSAQSGLPPFLVEESGLNSGFMMAQTTAAALVSECKVLAHPASVDTIPTSAGKEDHVPMSCHAARKLTEIVDNFRTVLAIEALAAAQGINLLAPLLPGPVLESVHRRIRTVVAPWEKDRIMAPDIEAMSALLRQEDLSDAASLAPMGKA